MSINAPREMITTAVRIARLVLCVFFIYLDHGRRNSLRKKRLAIAVHVFVAIIVVDFIRRSISKEFSERNATKHDASLRQFPHAAAFHDRR